MRYKSLYDALKDLAKDSPTLNRILGGDLPSTNPNRQIQKAFQMFSEIHKLESIGIDINDGDLHNDGCYVFFHFNPDEEYIFECNMDKMTVKIGKLIDYDAATFEDVEEFAFDWDVLATKLYQYRNVADPRQ